MGARHDHSAAVSSKRPALALELTAAFLIFKLVGAFVFDGLARLCERLQPI
jgi:hypothetical protein